MPGKVGDALRQRVLPPGRRRGQDALAEPGPPADASYVPPPVPAYRPGAPPDAFRPEPVPAGRPESPPAFGSQPPATFRPEPPPGFRPEPPAAAFGSEPPPGFRPEPPAAVGSEPPSTFRPEPPPAPAFRSEPPPGFRSAPPPGFRSEPPSTFRPEPPPAPAFRREPARVAETRETWVRRGQAQFDYLVGHGLQPGDRMLEIGCGTLRAGHLFIDYLSTGHYYGVDISPDALLAAQRIVAEFGLQAKMPHLTLVNGLDLRFLPASKFTVIQAHNVFAHSPPEMIGEGFAQVSRVMTRDAIFDFTFDRADGVDHQALRHDFHRRADTLIGLADAHGFDAELMEDWEPLGHGHSKLRLIGRG